MVANLLLFILYLCVVSDFQEAELELNVDRIRNTVLLDVCTVMEETASSCKRKRMCFDVAICLFKLICQDVNISQVLVMIITSERIFVW